MLRLILASASPRRVDLLSQIGVCPDLVEPAHIDETPQEGELPRLYAQRMAREKAESLAERYPADMVLAADTVVACGRRILPKAEDKTSAQACLTLLSGRNHRVYGAIALIKQGKVRGRLVETRLKFKRLDSQEIRAYLASGEWEGKAGGYAIQGLAGAFILSLVGSYSNVVGLSLYETYGLLQGAGLTVHKNWIP